MTIVERGQPFKCANCGREGLSAASHEEAMAEAEQLFGAPIPEDQAASLCDDCYAAFLKWFDTLSPADHARIRLGEFGG